jgi:hypothetical protein
LGLALSAVIVIDTIQIGEIEVIMRSEGLMSSGFGLNREPFSTLFYGKKGVEVGLPKCVHFHVSRSNLREQSHYHAGVERDAQEILEHGQTLRMMEAMEQETARQQEREQTPNLWDRRGRDGGGGRELRL